MDDHHGLGAANAGAPDDGWTVPQPETLPRPTWWPAVFALGSILVLWGFITSLIITGVGAVLFLAAVAGWIGELRHEHRS
jgi:hypothetical protein